LGLAFSLVSTTPPTDWEAQVGNHEIVGTPVRTFFLIEMLGFRGTLCIATAQNVILCISYSPSSINANIRGFGKGG
jgi:hypothetical protein